MRKIYVMKSNVAFQKLEEITIIGEMGINTGS